MWKKLNKILHDKNDYHLDPTLKNEIEISDELLQHTINFQKYLIPKKIKYLFTYDKLFFVRLFAKLLFQLVALILVIFLLYTIGYTIGIDVNFKIQKNIQKPDYSSFPIYIPSTGNLISDSIKIEEYKKIYNKNANIIYFYLKDTTNNYEKWKQKLAAIESNGSYDARRGKSQYWGKYQFSESARASLGLSEISWEKWKSNPELQEAAIRMWIDILYQDLKPDIEKYDGKFLNGWYITESGIIAMAHNVGAGATRQFLYSGGLKIPKDGSGYDATRFLILGNYDLKFKK